jgi:mycofactocin glycosyltransferase
VRRPVAGGPAAARNAALQHVSTEILAFLDSDCVAPADWLQRLLGHFDDPLVAAVAPRITPLQPRDGGRAQTAATRLSRYLAARCPLDMGCRSARVHPRTSVGYVPSAALLLRRSALAEPFDEELRYGEDVDLIWRLCGNGWRVRYDATVLVAHQEPSSLNAMLARRFRYGASAGPLSRRHGDVLAPATLSPAAALAALLALGGRRRAAAGVLACESARLLRSSCRLRLRRSLRLRLIGRSGAETARAISSCARTVGAPVTAVALARRRPLAVALALLAPALEWRSRRPPLDPVRWMVLSLLDDAAYGAGVWWGALRSRRPQALVPRVRCRPHITS